MKILKLSNNIEIKVCDNEVEKVLNAIPIKDTIVRLKHGVFNTSYFVAIANEDELENNKNQKEGVLHDGTMVIRHFGSWYLDGDFDDKGTPRRRIDSEYYPEVQRDCVPTRKTYQLKYKALPRKERLKLICEGTEAPREGGISKVNNLLKDVKFLK